MSIETDHLDEARRQSTHASNELAWLLDKPLRRPALKLAALRLAALLGHERECHDAEIRRQQKLINRLQGKLRLHEEDMAVQNHRIDTLEQQAIVERLMDGAAEDAIGYDLAAD